MGHEVAGGPFLKKRCIHFEDVAEDPVSHRLFKESGKTDDHIAPDKAEKNDEDGDKDNDSGKAQKVGWRDGQGLQRIDAAFDNSWYDELEKIDEDQGGKPTKDLQAMAAKRGQQEVAKLGKGNPPGCVARIRRGSMYVQMCGSVIVGKEIAEILLIKGKTRPSQTIMTVDRKVT